MPVRVLAAVFVSAAALGAGGAAAHSAPQRTAGDPCRPTALPACTSGAAARARAAASDAAALSLNGRELRGLGLPSLAAVVGSGRAAATRSKLNGEMVAALTRPLSKPRRKAARSPQALGGNTVGGSINIVQRTGTNPQLVRTIQVHVEASRCPRMTTAEASLGEIDLFVVASYGLSAVWTSGDKLIERSVLISLAPTKSDGGVDRKARYTGSSFRDVTVAVTSSGSVTRRGRAPTRYRTSVSLVANPTETGWKVQLESETFEAWIAREVARMNDESPPGQDDPIPARDAYVGMVRTFLRLVDAELHRATATAEREWQRPNTCARIAWNPEAGTAELAAGQTRTLEARIVAGVGGPGGASYWPTDPTQYVGKVLQALTVESRQGKPMKFVVQGAEAVRGRSVHFLWRVPSTVGVAEAEWTAKGKGLPAPWIGQARLTNTSSVGNKYTTGERREDYEGEVTMQVAFGPARKADPTYIVKSGTLTYKASGSTFEKYDSGVSYETTCKWELADTHRLSKYDGTLQLALQPNGSYKAFFFAAETSGKAVSVTEQCTTKWFSSHNPQVETFTQSNQIPPPNPLFYPTRKTEGFPVPRDLTVITASGGESRSDSPSPGRTERTSSRWNVSLKSQG